MSQVNTELGRSSTATISLGETAVRTLAGVASGAISMDNLRGKSNVSFTPDGGASAGTAVVLSDYSNLSSTVTINCSQSAVWNYTLYQGYGGYVSVASGNSSGSISFNITTTEFGGTLIASYTVSATAGGVTRYWDVTVQAADFS